MTESLAVVGLVVPGAAVMIAAGALIPLGALTFWPTLLTAVVGAVVGDGMSFWIGRRYGERLRGVWPFHRHPDWLSRGERFLRRHGGKSVLFGRFVGPVRPIVPLIAGMLGMRPPKFLAMNVLSAFGWAPAYLLPGIAFGASLALAGLVAERLVVLLVLVVVVAWLVIAGVRAVARFLSPRATAIGRRLTTWAGRHPRVDAVFGGILDPARGQFGTLLLMGATLIGTAWLFLGVLEDIVTGDPLVQADQGIFNLFYGLRTPWGDRFMVLVTELGDGVVITCVAATLLAWLLWCRRWRAAGYWAAAIGFGLAASVMIKLVLHRPRPVPSLYDGLWSYAFPSGHAVMSTVVYGFLAVLIARDWAPARRWIVYSSVVATVCLIAVSRLYLGAHWFSDVIGGLSLGTAWVSLLGIAYYRRNRQAPLPPSVPIIAVVALALAAGWHIDRRYSDDLARYTSRAEPQRMDASRWWQQDWRRLPAYREDLEGGMEQPLNLQWAGSLTALSAMLGAAGWTEPVPLAPRTALRWLLPAPSLETLPLLPQVHDGRHESLVLIRPARREAASGQGASGRPGQSDQLVLRLWATDIVLGTDSIPLWVGYVSLEGLRSFAMLNVPVGEGAYGAAVSQTESALRGVSSRTVSRDLGPGGSVGAWDGRVLLLRSD